MGQNESLLHTVNYYGALATQIYMKSVYFWICSLQYIIYSVCDDMAFRTCAILLILAQWATTKLLTWLHTHTLRWEIKLNQMWVEEKQEHYVIISDCTECFMDLCLL